MGGGGGYGPIPGADQEAELELPLEEAYRGGKRTLRLYGLQYDVDIPAGVLDGQRIRLAGQGGRGNGDAPPGDLYLVVRIKPHPRFRVQGRDSARALRIVEDARILEQAGAYSILLEMVPDRVCQIITERAHIPIISLGSGPHAAGQLLIFHDMFGLYPRFKPKMAKVYGLPLIPL